jgi:hypothetical protein
MDNGMRERTIERAAPFLDATTASVPDLPNLEEIRHEVEKSGARSIVLVGPIDMESVSELHCHLQGPG